MKRKNSFFGVDPEIFAAHARAGGQGAGLAARRAAAIAQGTDPELAREMLAIAIREQPLDPGPRLELGRLWAEAGDIEAAKKLANTVLNGAVDKAARARAAFMLGELARTQGEHAAAREHYHAALKIEEDLLDANRRDPAAARWYARARGRLAELDDAEGAHDRARAGAEGALAMLRAVAAHIGEAPVLAADIADAELRLAAMEIDDNQPASARRRLDEAIGRYEALAITEQEEPNWRAMLGDAWTLAAEAEFMRDAPERAREAMDTALQARLRLAAHDAESAWALAGAWRVRAALRAALGDNDVAAESHKQARRLAQVLLQNAADAKLATRFYVHTVLAEADHALNTGALALARDAADAARKHAEHSARARDADALCLSAAAACWDRLGEVARRVEDGAKACDAFARAVAFRRMALARDGDGVASQRGLAAALVRSGEAALAAQDQRAALSAFAESAELRRALLARAPESPAAAHALAAALERQGLAAQADGDRLAAWDAWSEELALADAIFGDDDNTEGMRFRAIVEAHLASLGGPDAEVYRDAALRRLDLLARAGALNEAEAALRRRLWGR